jgi:hypothetical protein
VCNRGGGGWGYVESIYTSNTLFILPDSEPTKLLYHPKQNLGGERPQTPASKSLYWSNLKKSQDLGFGVFIDIWSMVTRMNYRLNRHTIKKNAVKVVK